MSRRIEDLRDWFKPKVYAFLKGCEENGYTMLITRTVTTEKEQSLVYAIGRRELTEDEKVFLKDAGLLPSNLKKKKTNAEHAWQTPHGLGLAFDCIPIVGRKVMWNTSDEDWDRIYRVAEQCGLDALGDKWGEYLSWDKGHFQEPGWRLYRGGWA